MQDDAHDFKTGGINIKNLHYVDDANLIARNANDLQALVKKSRSTVIKMELNLNKKNKLITSKKRALEETKRNIELIS